VVGIAKPTLLILVAAGGCSFRPTYDGTHYRCGDEDSCPSGQTCIANVCVPAPTPDGGSGTGTGNGPPDAMQTPPGCGALDLLRDDFQTDQRGPLWTVENDGAKTVVTGGHFGIQIPGGNGDVGATIRSNYAYDFRNAVFETTVSQVAGKDTIVEVRGVAGGKLQMVVENGQLFAGVFDLPDQGTRAQVPYNPAQHKRWRIREYEGVVYWEWSDGGRWTELWHEPDPFPPDHVYALLSAGGQRPAAGEARFEEVNVDLPTPMGYCAASTLSDDFGDGVLGPQWEPWSSCNGSGTVDETGGQVVVSLDGTDDAYCGVQSTHLYDLRGDALFIDARTLPQVANAFESHAQLTAFGDGSRRLEFVEDNTTLYVAQQKDGNQVNGANTAYDPTQDRYWRIRASGSNVIWETSPDASNWSTQMSAKAAFDLSAVRLVFGGGEYNGPIAPHTIRFGGVNVK
jgi:hypothetical protein